LSSLIYAFSIILRSVYFRKKARFPFDGVRQGKSTFSIGIELEDTHTKLSENSNKQVCPASPALKGLPLKAGPCLPAGRKGHNIKGNTFQGSAAL
jgi:hypothetical protein